MATIGEQIEAACAALEAAGVVFGHGTDNAWDEATQLVLYVTGLADDAANLEVNVSQTQLVEIGRLLGRRIGERIPLAYLLGRCAFAGHDFLITPGVVIPRSPIGELIERSFQPWLMAPPVSIVDLCTGSGCIGIAAALAFPAARVTLIELDPQAAALAEKNVALHGLAGRVEVLQGDLFEPLPASAEFDLIVSNPPYVDSADMRSLPEEFRHEPGLGLSGGDDGLDIVRRIVDESLARLTPDGLLACEVGMSAPALHRAYPELPFIWPEFERGGEGVFLLCAREIHDLQTGRASDLT